MAGYLNVSEAAAALGVNRRTVWRLIATGQLEAVMNPVDRRAKLVRTEDVERLAQYTQKKGAAPK